jgi:hypothetical protein
VSLPPWSPAAVLASGFALAMSLLLATRLDGDLAALVAPVCGLLAAILFLLPPALQEAFAPVRHLAVAAAGGTVAATAAAVVHPFGTSALVGVGAAAGLWLLLLGSLGVLLARPCGGVAAALSWLVLLAALAALAPVWLGPVIDHTEPAQWITDALLAVNPLTHLGTLAGIDYLRSDWFYRHSPFGGLRYDYPSRTGVLAGLLLAGALASLAAGRGRTPFRRRRESAPTAAAAS